MLGGPCGFLAVDTTLRLGLVGPSLLAQQVQLERGNVIGAALQLELHPFAQ